MCAVDGVGWRRANYQTRGWDAFGSLFFLRCGTSITSWGARCNEGTRSRVACWPEPNYHGRHFRALVSRGKLTETSRGSPNCLL